MLALRFVFLAVAAVTLVLGVCESGDSDSTEQMKALKLALFHVGDDPDAVPPIGQRYDCTINIGHQPRPPASPLRAVGGTCIWDVARQGNNWNVTFHETWFCSDWAADAQGYPPCDSITGNHEWQYFVDLGAGTVSELSSQGQFAPDM